MGTAWVCFVLRADALKKTLSYCPMPMLFQLNDCELRKGKRIGVTISFNNHRLFVGNIPKNRDREELLEEFLKHARKSAKVTL